MALYRKGSYDVRFGESAFLCPDVNSPHFARNESHGDPVERRLRLPSSPFRSPRRGGFHSRHSELTF